MATLKLNNDWDLMLNAIGNIALIDGKEETAQDVATATRTFRGEYIFDTEKGVPYLENVLGQSSLNVDMKGYLENEALKVANVKSVSITNIAFENRVYNGNIEITTEN